MINYEKPFIEKRSIRSVEQVVCRYLSSPHKEQKYEFFLAIQNLISDPEAERLILYLPFSLLPFAPLGFKNAYRNAWYSLLCSYDVRENFHLGDCFEIDARPESGLERVVKVAHLTPWMLKHGYLTLDELANIIYEAWRRNDIVLLQSFKDTLYFLETYTPEVAVMPRFGVIKRRLRELPRREKQAPLYVSEKRKQWLEESGRDFIPLTPGADLSGNFSDNIPLLRAKINENFSDFSGDQIKLVGGSSLKGYGDVRSDFDIWDYDELSTNPETAPGSPGMAHVYFNCLWIGSQSNHALREEQAAACQKYQTLVGKERLMTLERLESDLVQYRLLHKGYARLKSWRKGYVPKTMDGDCPFYDDGFRVVATKLFVRYVWL